MYMNKSYYWKLLTLLFIAVIGVFGSVQAYNDSTIRNVAATYEEGYRLLQNKQWYAAIESLSASYNQIPFPMTAYLLSYAYSKGGDTSSAMKYANKALQGQPPLESGLREENKLKEPFVSEANRIINWAEDFNKIVTRYGGSADISAPTPPSNLIMPKTSQLSKASKAASTRDSQTKRRPLNGIYTIQQKSNGRYVDAHEGRQDNALVTRDRQNNDTQRWIIKPVGRNTYTIQQKSNGRYVDAHEGRQDNALVTRDRQSNDTQRWIMKHVGRNTYTIQQKSNGRYVDAHEGRKDNAMVTRDRQNNDTQQWIIK